MACGLWDPPSDQDFPVLTSTANESTCENYGLQCGLCFGYGHDVMEDTALDEKYCIQVLRILINKADSDIVELEEELLQLHSQLACTNDRFSDIFATSLRVESECLDISVRKLKDEHHDHPVADFSQINREPAEAIHDILKASFHRYFDKEEQKFADDVTSGSSSYYPVQVEKLLEENKPASDSLTANRMEKVKLVVTSIDKQAISKTTLRTGESLVGVKKQMSRSSNADRKKKAKDAIIRPVEKHTISKIRFISEHNLLRVKQRSESSNANIVERDREAMSIENNAISKRAFKTAEKNANLPDITKSADPTAKDSGRGSCLGFTERKRMSNSDSGSPQKTDAIIQYSTPSAESISHISALRTQGNWKHQPNMINFQPDDKSIGSRTEILDGTSEHIIAKPVVVQKTQTSNSISNKEKKRAKTSERIEVTNASLMDTAHDAADTLVELSNCRKISEAKSDPKKRRRRPPPKNVRKSVAASKDKGNLKLVVKQGSNREDEDSKSDPAVLESSLPRELGFPLSSIRTYKRRHEAGKIKSKGRVNLDLSQSRKANSPSHASSSSSHLLEGAKELRGLEIIVHNQHDIATASKEDVSGTNGDFRDDSDTEACSSLDLDYYTVDNLKAIAKELKLKGYSKLNKSKLIEFLGIKLIEGRKKQKRKESFD